jgi:large subunit ribosomal protein L18e
MVAVSPHSHYIYLGNFEYTFVLHMFAQTVIDNTIWTLRNAFKRNKAPIWRALQEELAGPRANRREINVRRLAQITKANEVVVVPGKVLGTGSLGHKLTVCAFSISETAAKKIIESGGKVVTFDDLINKHPDGKGVRIIG